jgi:phosphatidylethanolamine/phosphatidyl-N-methylethanolamine N-methyltransferase
MPDFTERHVTRTYRRYAPVYDVVFGGTLESGRRRLCEAVCGVAPRRLLEVGVGTGLTLARYPASTALVGIDISQEMLDRAQQRAADLPDRSVSLLRMSGEALAFDDASFDCVTLPYVLSVTPDPHRLVAEARRVCAPGGHIFIVNHFSGSPVWKPLEWLVGPVAGSIGFRSRFDYAEHVLAHDWQVLSVKSVNLMGLSKLVHLRNA